MSEHAPDDNLPAARPKSAPTSDPWIALRRHTPARIAIGRAGGSLPTQEVLSFSLACAAAHDAVHASFDPGKIARELQLLGEASIEVNSAAGDLETYLQRPDLGRRLNEESRTRLATMTAGKAACDVAIVVAGGLSPIAAQMSGASAATSLLNLLRGQSLRTAPIILASRARVAIADEIGELLRAEVAVILIGERPGLTAPDSLGAYLTHQPRVGRNDSDRNCISNIRPSGLSVDQAAQALASLVARARRCRASGIALQKQTAGRDALGGSPTQNA